MSTPSHRILKTGQGQEFWTGERCFITELINDPSLADVSLARARVEPGVTTELHALTVRELYIIELGTGLFDDGRSEPVEAGPGTCIEIPPNAPQRITNTGDTDLVFLCLCTPRFDPAGYRSLEAS